MYKKEYEENIGLPKAGADLTRIVDVTFVFAGKIEVPKIIQTDSAVI